MNWKGFGSKQSWPNQGTIMVFVWRDWRKQWYGSARIAGVLFQIWTEHFQNMSLLCYYYTKPPVETIKKTLFLSADLVSGIKSYIDLNYVTIWCVNLTNKWSSVTECSNVFTEILHHNLSGYVLKNKLCLLRKFSVLILYNFWFPLCMLQVLYFSHFVNSSF